MNKTLQTSTIYLIGIGGIGMSALARFFRQQGKEVSGYDRYPTPLTRQLENEGMNIHYNDDPAYVPCDVGLVIYTPAIPADNRELSYCREIDVPVKKRSEVLEMITEGNKTIAVAGTHGKTTISSMVAHILHHNKVPVNAFIGGIMSNYDSNLIRSEKSDLVLAEADEYDRSFLKLDPYIGVVSAIEPDHLDIYGSLKDLEASFAQFIAKIKPDGKAIIHQDVANKINVPENTVTYGISEQADVRADDIAVKDHSFTFKLLAGDEQAAIKMMLPGQHNIENACAAVAVCIELGLQIKQVKEGLESYKGVKRRFEFKIRKKDLVYVDDYAHHPDEIAACISTIKALYPEKQITGIFQPHLYTRTRDFAEGFAKSLEALDELILLDIYPAREEPIAGVSSDIIFKRVNIKNKLACSKEELLEVIESSKREVVVTMGAGDIDQLIEPIKEKLLKQG